MKIFIRMKRYSIIMMSILFMLISCAEEGPYKMGQLECSIKCDMITSTSAIVSVKIPQNNENLLNDIDFVYITDRPLNNYETIAESNIIKPSEKIGYNSATEEYAYIFNGLLPNTTYYFLIDTDIQYDHDRITYPIYYYPGFSFTTKKEGDDSELLDNIKLINNIFGDIKLELVNYNYDNTTNIRMIYSNNSEFSGYFYASTSPNFENSVKSQVIATYSGESITIRFSPILEKEKYYLKFEGKICVYGNVYFKAENISFLIPDTIDLTN